MKEICYLPPRKIKNHVVGYSAVVLYQQGSYYGSTGVNNLWMIGKLKQLQATLLQLLEEYS
jgi:hypothetical protein